VLGWGHGGRGVGNVAGHDGECCTAPAAIRWQVVSEDFDLRDPEGDDDADAPLRPTRAADRFKRTVPGAVLAGAAMALHDLLDAKVIEEAPIIMEAPGDPPGDRAVDVDLDPDDPTASSVLLRPHLLEGAVGAHDDTTRDTTDDTTDERRSDA
jgi:hypothetical protein